MFLSEVNHDRTDVGEPSHDTYSSSTPTECFISEPPPAGVAPLPYLADGDELVALNWLRSIKPQALQEEIERIKLIRAARELAKFIHASGNREKLVSLVDDAMAKTGPGTGASQIEQDSARDLRERLKALGVLE